MRWEHHNRALTDLILTNEKEAQEVSNRIIRRIVREDSIILGHILPPEDPINIQYNTDDEGFHTVVSLEPISAGAVDVPFDTRGELRYIRGERMRLNYRRLLSKTYTIDEARLKNYDYDVLGMYQWHSGKDIHDRIDINAFAVVDQIVGATANAPSPLTGLTQYRSFAGGVSRDNFNEALKIMQQLPSKLTPAICVINQNFVNEIQKWNRSEFGGDISAEVAINGFNAVRTLFGKKLVITIKDNIVPDNVMYMFASPDYLGKCFRLQDFTVYTRKEDYMYYFTLSAILTLGFGNVAGIAKAEFTP